MKPLDLAAMVMLLIQGSLVLMMGLMSTLSGLLSGAMTFLLVSNGEQEALFFGIPLVLVYALWMLVCLVGGPVQLAAGAAMASGRPKGLLTWAGIVAALLSGVTVYCAITGVITFVLGLCAILLDRTEESP